MKKKLLSLAMIIFLSGCTINYNLNISNDNFEETINATIPKTNKNLINYYTENNEFIGENIVYEKTIKDSGINKVFSYSHVYSYKEFQNRLNPCFSNSKISEENGYYSIYANGFTCFANFDVQADKYTINIKTDYNVINQNADKKSGNTYTWNFKKDNFKNKSIIFQYTKNNKPLKLDYKSIIISLVVAIIIFSGLVFYEVSKNRQKVEV